MAEAQLRIKPTVVGSVRSSIARDSRLLSQMDRQQVSALRSGVREASRLERAYIGVGRGISVATRGVRTITSSIFNLKTAVLGIAAGGAGKSLLENTIGRADQVARAKALLGTVLKDQNKVNKAVEEARNLTKEISSLDFASALGGIEKTVLLAGGDIAKSKEIVKIAKALEAGSNGAQDFEGALFALKELETGDVVSLRERFGFRLPTQADAKKAAKKSKKTLQQYYFDELVKIIDTRHGDAGRRLSGVNALLDIQRSSIPGQLDMLKTSVSDVFTTIGDEAAKVAIKELPLLVEELDKLKASPQLQKDIRDMAAGLAGMTKSAIGLARELPKTINSISQFVRKHPDLVKIGAGLVATDVATGGLVRKGVGAALGGGASIVGKAITGKGGKGSIAGQMLGAAGAAGAVPVYVVNMGEFGGGGSILDDAANLVDDVAKTSLAQQAGQFLSKVPIIGKAFSGGSLAGGMAPLAAAGTAALGLGAAGTLAGVAAYQAASGTERNLKIADSLGPNNNLRTMVPKFTPRSDRFVGVNEFAGHGAVGGVRGRAVGASFRSQIDQAMMTSDPSARRSVLENAFAQARTSLESSPRAQVDSMIVQMNKDLEALGLKVSNNKGELRLVVDAESARAAFGEGVMRNVSLTLHYHGSGSREDAEDMLRQTERGLKELARRDQKIGAG